jgi:hypothetical protein
MELQLQRAGDGAGAVDDGARRVRLPSGDGIDEEQLLLDADRERPLRAEASLVSGAVAQDASGSAAGVLVRISERAVVLRIRHRRELGSAGGLRAALGSDLAGLILRSWSLGLVVFPCV